MTARHTPGEWYIEERDPAEHTITTGEDGIDIAYIYQGLPDIAFEESKANARLIAAAPALLAACKRANRTIMYLLSCVPLSDITDQERQDHKSVKSAISAGEGEK